MVYNVLSLWSPPGRTEPYSSRYQWPDDRSYEGLISDPANALGALAGKAHLKYVEVKAVIGGVTAIQGSAKMAYPYEGWLVRNVEYETFKTGKKSVYQSALPLRTDADYAVNRERMERGAAFLYHVSEGTDPALVAEYRKLRDERCLKPRFCGIHCTALERPNFGRVGAARRLCDLVAVLEPVALPRHHRRRRPPKRQRACASASAPTGRRPVPRTCSASSRSQTSGTAPSSTGSSPPKNSAPWRPATPPTRSAGRSGSGSSRSACTATCSSRPTAAATPTATSSHRGRRDVLFVAINGYPFYGTYNLMRSARAEHAEPIRVGRHRRRIVLIYPGIRDADMGWSAALADIAEAKADPVARYLEIEKLHQVGKPPPWLQTDKPWDNPEVTGEPVPVTVRIPPLDPLTHSGAYFNAIKNSPLHGKLLDRLRDYYS